MLKFWQRCSSVGYSASIVTFICMCGRGVPTFHVHVRNNTDPGRHFPCVVPSGWLWKATPGQNPLFCVVRKHRLRLTLRHVRTHVKKSSLNRQRGNRFSKHGMHQNWTAPDQLTAPLFCSAYTIWFACASLSVHSRYILGSLKAPYGYGAVLKLFLSGTVLSMQTHTVRLFGKLG